MKNETTRKVINVDKLNMLPLWSFKECDDVVLKLSLYKDSLAFDITGQTISLGARTQKGLVEQIDGFTINKNELDIALKNSILVQGIVEIELNFRDVSGNMTTASFFITVNSKILNDTAVEATNEFDTFTKTVEVINADYNSLRGGLLATDKVVYFQDEINKTNLQLDTIETQKATKQEVEVERKRIDSFTNLPQGSTTGDAELIDGRVGANGITYSNIGSAIRGQVKELNSGLDNIATPTYTNYFDFDNINLKWTEGYYYSNSEKNFVANSSRKCNKNKVSMRAGNYYVFTQSVVEFVCFKNNEVVKIITASNNILTLDSDYDVICNFNSPFTNQLIVTDVSNTLNIKKGYKSETIFNINEFDKIGTIKSKIEWITGHYLENATLAYAYEPRFICSKIPVTFDKSYLLKPSDGQYIQVIMVQNGVYKGHINWTSESVYVSNIEGISYYINLKRIDNLYIDNTNKFANLLTFNEMPLIYNHKWVSGMGLNSDGTIQFHFGTGYGYGARLISDYITANEDTFISCTNATLDFNICYSDNTSSGFLNQKGYLVAKGKKYRLMLRYADTTKSLLSPYETVLNDLIIKEQKLDTTVNINDRPVGKYLITPYINGFDVREQLSTNEVNLTETEAYSHGSSMVIKNNKAYVVCIANTQTKAEFDDYVFVRLSVFDIATPTQITNYVVASKGIYNGIELQGVCSCVGITENGDNLEIVFYSKVNGNVTELHRTFNTLTSTFGDIAICNFKFNEIIYPFTAKNIDSVIGAKYSMLPIGFEMAMETFSLVNGYWYTWLCSGASGEYTGILFKTNDFINYEFVLVPEFRTKADCEIMNYYFNGYLYTAYRRNYSDNSMLLAKFDLTKKICVDKVVLTDCGSRPHFYEYNSKLYLIHSTSIRRNTAIVEVNTTRLIESYPIASIEDFTFSYFCPVVIGDKVYLSYSSNGAKYGAIKFSHFTANMNFASYEVGEKLLALVRN